LAGFAIKGTIESIFEAEGMERDLLSILPNALVRRKNLGFRQNYTR
jgi:hypothetical protein